MQHPFEGILSPASPESTAEGDWIPSAAKCEDAPHASRRNVLKRLVAGGTVVLGASTTALAEPKNRKPSQQPASSEAQKGERGDSEPYDRYVVIPKDFRKFRTARRTKLGIGGGFFRIALDKKRKTVKSGFLAWLTEEGAETLRQEPDVLNVRRITPQDIPGPGKKPKRARQLMIRLAPNGWRRVKPPTESYTPTAELVSTWSKQFDTVKFKASKSPGIVLVNIGPAGIPENLVASLKKHGQVVGIHWNAVATTLALGEEAATTKALGEEGGKQPRTTKALGEEGGKQPRPRPPGKVTTLALGEEGGGKR